jgi:hypothetical protein
LPRGFGQRCEFIGVEFGGVVGAMVPHDVFEPLAGSVPGVVGASGAEWRVWRRDIGAFFGVDCGVVFWPASRSDAVLWERREQAELVASALRFADLDAVVLGGDA